MGYPKETATSDPLEGMRNERSCPSDGVVELVSVGAGSNEVNSNENRHAPWRSNDCYIASGSILPGTGLVSGAPSCRESRPNAFCSSRIGCQLGFELVLRVSR